MKKNNYGFSLPLAMGLVVIMSLLAYTMLEYIIPFSRDVKGVENSSKSYYQASSAVEDGLYYLNVERTDEISDISTTFAGDISNKYVTTSIGNIIPPAGEGNSQYDNNWNTISQGNPIQLSVGNDYLDLIGPDDFDFYIRIPDLDNDLDNGDITLSGSSVFPSTPIVNWQLSSLSNTLYASGTIIRADDIGDGTSSITFDFFQGADVNGNEGPNQIFENFYDDNCGTSSGCIFKASVVNSLSDEDNGNSIPYLEWKIQTTQNIPLRYIKLDISGKSMGFKKDLEVKVPTETVNEAFDFTVFQ